eukprot:TRINITY_DN1588_c0_g2_i1.p1 TRINITY_DN1588_c0_g2~~TRINITY_DN1588_c0_g2_i1.p1  ORF type:complete len:789 (-),score=153.08 TRINITY_DN1588_c0_g2_i1:36-2210(-)
MSVYGKIPWGVCVPTACSNDDVVTLLKQYLNPLLPNNTLISKRESESESLTTFSAEHEPLTRDLLSAFYGGDSAVRLSEVEEDEGGLNGDYPFPDLNSFFSGLFKVDSDFPTVSLSMHQNHNYVHQYDVSSSSSSSHTTTERERGYFSLMKRSLSTVFGGVRTERNGTQSPPPLPPPLLSPGIPWPSNQIPDGSPHFTVAGATLFVVTVILFIFCLSVTVVVGIKKQRARAVGVASTKEGDDTSINILRDKTDDDATPLLSSSSSSPPSSATPLISPLLTAFDFSSAISALTRQPPLALRALDGIRALSFMYVVLGHSVALVTYTNPTYLSYAHSAYSIVFVFIATGFRSVDTFFFLSALLVAYLVTKRLAVSGEGLGVRGVLLLVVGRLVRLTPIYMFWLLTWWFTFPMISGGPLASLLSVSESCNDFWWTNLLYINNFYPSFEKECMGWSWYLANDMQMYILLAPLTITLFLHLSLKKNWSNLKFFTVVILPVVLLSVGYRLWAALPSGGNVMYMANGYMDLVYSKPYSRVAPFAIGLGVGCFIGKEEAEKSSSSPQMLSPSPSQSRSIVSKFRWLFHAFALLGFAFSSVTLNWVLEDQALHFRAVNVIYITLSPTIWSLSLSWLSYACYHRVAPSPLQNFLEAPMWSPLARLGLGVYLTHPIVLILRQIVAMRLASFSFFNLIDTFISNVVIANILSFIGFLLIEYPTGQLFKFFLSCISK